MTKIAEQKVVFSSKQCIEIINIYLKERGNISTQLEKNTEKNNKVEEFGYANKTVHYFINLIKEINKNNKEKSKNSKTRYLFSYDNWRGKTQFLATVKETSEYLFCDFSIYNDEKVSEVLTPESISTYIS
jgi:hypothetical protein